MRVEIYNSNGTKKPGFKKQPRKYNEPFPPATPVSIFKGAPQTDCSRHDNLAKQVREYSGMICIHPQDERYPPELLSQIDQIFNLIQGDKI